MNKIELLLPAKNAQTGIVAINHGADAVYVGAPKFGARQCAANDLQDVKKLVDYAHVYGSKVYVTLNTVLFDEELEEVRSLIHALYNIGVDALIIQDLGILKLDIPPIRLHASTQCHNDSLERILFLEKLGMQRAILAREMDLSTIRAIKKESSIELELFVHGSLCVSYSGQCYMSKQSTGRSGNRGECAQLCRTPFDLIDAKGQTLIKDKHLLSIRDMNRSDYLLDILNAGVCSLKIEGRLKDENYVKNITSFYRQKLDNIMENYPIYQRQGSGKTKFFFPPDPSKTFNRGFTPYFIDGQRTSISTMDTPKAMGKCIGKLYQNKRGDVLYEGTETIVNGDGLCFINAKQELEGFFVNRVEGKRLFPHKPLSGFHTVSLYRNVDKQFEKSLSDKTAERKVLVELYFKEEQEGFKLAIKDEDGCKAEVFIKEEKIAAKNREMALNQLKSSLVKVGNTPFEVRELHVDSAPYFWKASTINHWRNELTNQLLMERKHYFHPKDTPRSYHPTPLFHEVNYKRNITNDLHKKVYADFGATEVAYGVDKTKEYQGKELMVCKYCLRYELGLCSKQAKNTEAPVPLFLKDKKNRYRLVFDCKACLMKVMAD